MVMTPFTRDAGTAARWLVVLTDSPYHEMMVVDAAKGGTVQGILNLLYQERIRLSLMVPEMECFDTLSEVDKCCCEMFEVDPALAPKQARRKVTACVRDCTSKPDYFVSIAALPSYRWGNGLMRYRGTVMADTGKKR